MSLLFLPIDIDLTDFKFIISDRSVQLKEYNPYWSSTPIDHETVMHNGLDKVLEKLPFIKITTLTHKIQQLKVGGHVDVYPSMTFEEGEYEHIKSNEPCGYRIVLNGKNNSLKINNGKTWVDALLPTIPCCYLLDSTKAIHSVEDDYNRETIYLRGFIDGSRHKNLIDISLQKYKEYAVTLL